MIDREQIRRDAEGARRPIAEQPATTIYVLADHCDALLAELEQADERIRRRAEVTTEIRDELAAAEARLAKVPALVEALRPFADSYSWHHNYVGNGIIFEQEGAHYGSHPHAAIGAARAALAVWEDE